MKTGATQGDPVQTAAEVLLASEALVVTAGAGMGVDSGLPDFRGREGFWRAYPMFRALGLAFESIADPRWFHEDPALAWGFYGHRLNLYRDTQPHPGFDLLLAIGRARSHGYFVVTSNVDGHFGRAGFDPQRIVEVHGSIHHAQCVSGCGVGLFPAPEGAVDIDPAQMRARGPLPRCPGCKGLARPNILMFGDADWDEARSLAQHRRFTRWLASLEGRKVAVVELGAGTAIATIRHTSEHLVQQTGGTLVRINAREAQVPPGHLSVQQGALPALQAIAARMGGA